MVGAAQKCQTLLYFKVSVVLKCHNECHHRDLGSCFGMQSSAIVRSLFLFIFSLVWVFWEIFLNLKCWSLHFGYSIAGDCVIDFGSNQANHIWISGSSLAVSSLRWSQLLPETAVELWFPLTPDNLTLAPDITGSMLPFDKRLNQGRAGMEQAVMESWAFTHHDKISSCEDGGKKNTLLKGEVKKKIKME